MDEPSLWLSRLTVNYSAADAVAAFLNLAGLVVVVRTLSVEEFGLADLLRTVHTFLVPLVSLNVFAGACRFYFDTDDREERRRILGGALTVQLLAGSAAALLVGFSQPIWQRYVDPRITREAVWLVALGIPATSLAVSLTQTAVITGRLRHYAVLVVSQAASTLIGVFVLVVWYDGRLEGYLLSVLLASAFAGSTGYALQASHYRLGRLPPPYGRYVRYGAPFAVGGGVQYGFVLALRLMLAKLASSQALGFYALAERTQLPLAIVTGAAGKAWHPWVLTNRPAFNQKIHAPVRQLNGLVLVVVGTLIIFLQEVIGLLGGARYAAAHGTALLLLLGTWIFFLGDWVVSVSLILAKRSHFFIWVYLFGYGVGGLVAAAMIPRWGSQGGAAGAVVASTLIFFAMLAISRLVYPLNLRLGRLVPASGVALGLAVLGSVQAAVWSKPLFLAAYVLVLWALNLLPLPSPLTRFHPDRVIQEKEGHG